MKKNWIICFLMAFIALFSSCSKSKKELTVLQFNIWQQGTIVDDGFNGIVDNIIALDPDFITFSEVRNYNNVEFIPFLVSELEKKGKKYYGEHSVSTGIISKHEIQEQKVVFPLENDRGSVLKASFLIDNLPVVVYSAHLDWLNCSYYLPRAYDASTWEKLEAPILDVDSVLRDSRLSFRLKEVQSIVDDAKKEAQRGALIFIGGDFNEPSHLDWQSDTKDIRDHQGLVIDWECSLLLVNNGFIDAFREQFPDPVAYPGFTFPADTKGVELKKLVWAPEADERDRIDFIYYRPFPGLSLSQINVVGPSGDILCGERVANSSEDVIIQPVGVWPTDHKAVFAKFVLE